MAASDRSKRLKAFFRRGIGRATALRLAKEGAAVAVLDIDSDLPAAFDETDATELAAILAQVFAR